MRLSRFALQLRSSSTNRQSNQRPGPRVLRVSLTRSQPSSGLGIRRVPAEVLEVIFHHAVHDPDAALQHLVCIMLTCRQWRKTALLSPRLWSRLPIISGQPNGPPTVEDIERIRHTVHLFLAKSGNHPLTFHFHTYYSPWRDQEPLAEIFPLLISHCQRWESATMTVSHRLLKVLSSIRGNLPLLRSLNLIIHDTERDMQTIDYFSICPSLHHACLSTACTFEGEGLIVQLPWSQLETFWHQKSLYSGQVCLSQTFEEGEDIPKPIQFSAYANDFVFVQKELPQRLHSQLTTLTLSVVATPPLLDWLSESLSLPYLTQLELNLRCDFPPPFSLRHILSFIQRSGCSLKGLHIQVEDVFCEPGVLPQILALCEDLEEMSLPMIPREDLRELTLGPDTPTILVPKLRNLVVSLIHEPLEHGDVPALFYGPALTQMALSRDSAAKLYLQHLKVDVLNVVVRCQWGTDTCRSVFQALEEGSHPPVHSLSLENSYWDAKQTIWKWGVALRDLCVSHKAPGWRLFTPSIAHEEGKRLNEVLEEMENYPVEHLDVILLQKYSIFGTLEHGRCTTLSPICRLCETRHRVTERLKAIKDKWLLAIVSNIALYQRWEFIGNYQLAYIPLHDRRRGGCEPWLIATSCELHGQHLSDHHYHESF